MAKSLPEFYADYDGTKIFWKFWDFDQKNPVLKFDVFFAIISTWLHNYVPEFGCMAHFFHASQDEPKRFWNFKNFTKFRNEVWVPPFLINSWSPFDVIVTFISCTGFQSRLNSEKFQNFRIRAKIDIFERNWQKW